MLNSKTHLKEGGGYHELMLYRNKMVAFRSLTHTEVTKWKVQWCHNCQLITPFHHEKCHICFVGLAAANGNSNSDFLFPSSKFQIHRMSRFNIGPQNRTCLEEGPNRKKISNLIFNLFLDYICPYLEACMWIDGHWPFKHSKPHHIQIYKSNRRTCLPSRVHCTYDGLCWRYKYSSLG